MGEISESQRQAICLMHRSWTFQLHIVSPEKEEWWSQWDQDFDHRYDEKVTAAAMSVEEIASVLSLPETLVKLVLLEEKEIQRREARQKQEEWLEKERTYRRTLRTEAVERARSIVCPKCGADVQKPCFTKHKQPKPMPEPHSERVTLAERNRYDEAKAAREKEWKDHKASLAAMTPEELDALPKPKFQL